MPYPSVVRRGRGIRRFANREMPGNPEFDKTRVELPDARGQSTRRCAVAGNAELLVGSSADCTAIPDRLIEAELFGTGHFRKELFFRIQGGKDCPALPHNTTIRHTGGGGSDHKPLRLH